MVFLLICIWIYAVGLIVIPTLTIEDNLPTSRLGTVGIILFFAAWPIVFSWAILLGLARGCKLK